MRVLVVLAFALGGCATEPDAELVIPSTDPAVFKASVYPILLRDCGYTTCHGTHDRFFAVFGPGRARLDPATDMYAPATPYEVALSYTRARSMLLAPDGARASLLVRKPVPISQGGARHGGDDLWGAPVYTTIDDPSYGVLYRWATTGGIQ